MTSLTALGFPFQQGTDRPCDAPATWCSWASIMESKLITADNNIGRFFPTIPAAQVVATNLTFTPTSFGSSVIWQSSVIDTDGMFNIATFPASIVPKRTGSYLVDAMGVALTTGTSTTPTTMAIINGAFYVNPINPNSATVPIIAEDDVVMSEAANHYMFHASVRQTWGGTGVGSQGVTPQGFGVIFILPAAGVTSVAVPYVTLSACWIEDQVL